MSRAPNASNAANGWCGGRTAGGSIDRAWWSRGALAAVNARFGKRKVKRECWGQFHLCRSFQPRLGFPSQAGVFYLSCLDSYSISLSPALASALQTWEIPLLRAWALRPPQASDFHPSLSLSWPVITFSPPTTSFLHAHLGPLSRLHCPSLALHPSLPPNPNP